MPPLISMQNVYMRLISYAVTPILGLLPAWLLGFITITDAWLLRIDYAGLAVSGGTGLILSLAIFAKWGIKPVDVFSQPQLMGSLMRVVTYGLTTFIGLLPANIAATVYIDTLNSVLTVDLPSLAYAVASAIGLNLGVFAMFGVKQPAPK